MVVMVGYSRSERQDSDRPSNCHKIKNAGVAEVGGLKTPGLKQS